MATSIVKWMVAVLLVHYSPHNDAVLAHKHPFYVSVTEIDHNAKDKTLEISCKIFTNDFETALEKATNSKVDLHNPKDKNETDKKISGYIMKHLQTVVDGKPQTLQFVGTENK